MCGYWRGGGGQSPERRVWKMRYLLVEFSQSLTKIGPGVTRHSPHVVILLIRSGRIIDETQFVRSAAEPDALVWNARHRYHQRSQTGFPRCRHGWGKGNHFPHSSMSIPLHELTVGQGHALSRVDDHAFDDAWLRFFTSDKFVGVTITKNTPSTHQSVICSQNHKEQCAPFHWHRLRRLPSRTHRNAFCKSPLYHPDGISWAIIAGTVPCHHEFLPIVLHPRLISGVFKSPMKLDCCPEHLFFWNLWSLMITSRPRTQYALKMSVGTISNPSTIACTRALSRFPPNISLRKSMNSNCKRSRPDIEGVRSALGKLRE
jgi:hypothetical protein